MDESSFNMAVRKFLKEVGVTSQREIERTAENAPLKHVVEQTIDVR